MIDFLMMVIRIEMSLVYSVETVHNLGQRNFIIECRLKIKFSFLTVFISNIKVIDMLQLMESIANETVI